MQTTFLFQGLHMKLDFTTIEPMNNISLLHDAKFTLDIPINNNTIPVKPEVSMNVHYLF